MQTPQHCVSWCGADRRVQPCTRRMSIPGAWSWGTGPPPYWVLEQQRAAESPGLGARERGEQPDGSWEERGTPRQRVQEQQRMMHPQLLCGLSKVGFGLPACLGHPKASPSPAGRCWQWRGTTAPKLCGGETGVGVRVLPRGCLHRNLRAPGAAAAAAPS